MTDERKEYLKMKDQSGRTIFISQESFFNNTDMFDIESLKQQKGLLYWFQRYIDNIENSR